MAAEKQFKMLQKIGGGPLYPYTEPLFARGDMQVVYQTRHEIMSGALEKNVIIEASTTEKESTVSEDVAGLNADLPEKEVKPKPAIKKKIPAKKKSHKKKTGG